MLKRAYMLIMVVVLLWCACSCFSHPNLSTTSKNNIEPPNSTVKQITSAGAFEEKNAVLDYFYSRRYTATILENEDFVLYGKKDGVWKQNKNTQQTTLLCSAESPDALYLEEDWLYYTTDKYSNLSRVSLDGRETELVFNGTESTAPNGVCGFKLFDYQIEHGVLYLFNTAFSIAYDLKSQRFLDCMPDDLAEVSQVKGGKMYYISHLDDTFSLKCLDLASGEAKLLYGQGIENPKENLYYNFLFTDNALCLCQRLPRGVYYIQDQETRILTDEELHPDDLMYVDHILYYVVCYDPELYWLYGYDPVTDQCVCSVRLDHYDQNHGFTVVNGYVYYCVSETVDSDDSAPCIYMKNIEGDKLVE